MTRSLDDRVQTLAITLHDVVGQPVDRYILLFHLVTWSQASGLELSNPDSMTSVAAARQLRYLSPQRPLAVGPWMAMPAPDPDAGAASDESVDGS